MSRSCSSRNGKLKPLRTTPRDIDMLEFIGEHRLVLATVLQDRFWPGRGPRARQNRLNLLVQHGLLQPLKPDLRGGKHTGGGETLLYALTPKGADLVQRERGVRPRRVVKHELSQMTLRHDEQMVRVRLVWDAACQRNGLELPTWFLSHDRDPAAPDGAAPVDQCLLFFRLTFRNQRVTAWPDAASLTLLPKPAGGNASHRPLVTLWELDRSKMGHKQLSEKVAGHTAAIEQAAWRRLWPDIPEPLVRVMWVCQDQRRIDNMRATFEEHGVADYYRYMLLQELQPHSVLTSRIWQKQDGTRVAILTGSAADR